MSCRTCKAVDNHRKQELQAARSELQSDVEMVNNKTFLFCSKTMFVFGIPCCNSGDNEE